MNVSRPYLPINGINRVLSSTKGDMLEQAKKHQNPKKDLALDFICSLVTCGFVNIQKKRDTHRALHAYNLAYFINKNLEGPNFNKFKLLYATEYYNIPGLNNYDDLGYCVIQHQQDIYIHYFEHGKNNTAYINPCGKYLLSLNKENRIELTEKLRKALNYSKHTPKESQMFQKASEWINSELVDYLNSQLINRLHFSSVGGCSLEKIGQFIDDLCKHNKSELFIKDVKLNLEENCIFTLQHFKEIIEPKEYTILKMSSDDYRLKPYCFMMDNPIVIDSNTSNLLWFSDYQLRTLTFRDNISENAKKKLYKDIQNDQPINQTQIMQLFQVKVPIFNGICALRKNENEFTLCCKTELSKWIVTNRLENKLTYNPNNATVLKVDDILTIEALYNKAF